MNDRTTTVVQVGAHGYGRVHLDQQVELADEGVLRVVGVADPRPPDAELIARLGGPETADSLEPLLRRHSPDIVVIATPIHTHVPLAVTAMRAGAHVLVEKPPTATLAEFEKLLAVATETGRGCQIGFQSLGSTALDRARELIADGVLGELRGVGGAGTWIRDAAYYARSPWAGRMTLDGVAVTDGALTNPFAHAVASALRVVGAEERGSLRSIEVERFRARPIETDDTACVRVVTSTGVPVTVAVTLSAATTRDPVLILHGTRGTVRLWYTRDELRLEIDGVEQESARWPRVGLLRNLAEHIADPAVELLSPAARSHSFMSVLEAIRLDGPAEELAAEHYRLIGEGPALRPVVDGVDDAVFAAAERLALFSELDLAWA
ncbi:putative dehydrogenase [Actinoalloteichus hoggarensis]|uniref:Putative oxidoreductase YcjS n=1 Tax=Actinoalloteichus hoggarensis TaxID=1470176 RepID=A0A221W8C1_9PSEU|nr:Gfo/Idh/MocA family oxidoreductase [Actinoalloteichus hoggarensis]ASO21963.1 putative oxidoreductase YcjS [Actinoalloteichus hoggarensis]MBB5923957.1 putative dehydrogenase [Actinoalloteichus hoggarensis]